MTCGLSQPALAAHILPRFSSRGCHRFSTPPFYGVPSDPATLDAASQQISVLCQDVIFSLQGYRDDEEQDDDGHE